MRSEINQEIKIEVLQEHTHTHTHLLHVDLNVLLEVVLVQVDDEVAHKVEAVAHNDKGKLIRQFGLLQEILDNLYRKKKNE
jgi:hypothetical protein